MLHAVTEAGGLGFCHAALPGLLPVDYHGPLVVALDSNALIDLQQYGNRLLNEDPLDVDDAYAEDLSGLGDLLNLWLLRDIRFVVTPRSLTDAKKVTQRFRANVVSLRSMQSRTVWRSKSATGPPRRPHRAIPPRPLVRRRDYPTAPIASLSWRHKPSAPTSFSPATGWSLIEWPSRDRRWRSSGRMPWQSNL
jgi:hypothetical protein